MGDQQIIGIRFQKVGKLYHFDTGGLKDLVVGDYAVVNTSRGRQLGQVMGFVEDPPKPPRGTWKKIERKATPGDLALRQALEQKELAITIDCRAKASELGYEGLKIVASEFSFDSDSIAVLYNYEEQNLPDLTPLGDVVRENYPEAELEFRRIGPRDVAKIIGGMGACGLEVRCCSTFLTEFSPISIKMAKAQGVSLDPSEITGMCGRLRCCLIYEYEQYVEARKTLPKRGKKVVTPLGEGKVIDLYPIQDMVVVLIEGEERKRAEFYKDEIEPWDELEALRRKSEAPCDKHENGDCDCGKQADKRK
ncbi:MAG TPA: stage 0 sporulation family protein [Chloroflexi bacterium]|nr:stage 0 sporulation family protein [Chloroflexota bacterium]